MGIEDNRNIPYPAGDNEIGLLSLRLEEANSIEELLQTTKTIGIYLLSLFDLSNEYTWREQAGIQMYYNFTSRGENLGVTQHLNKPIPESH